MRSSHVTLRSSDLEELKARVERMLVRGYEIEGDYKKHYEPNGVRYYVKVKYKKPTA